MYVSENCIIELVKTYLLPVADPGFPRGGGANSPGGGRQHMILPNFPKNCMKLKEFEPPGWGGGARPKFYYVDPPLVTVMSLFTSKVYVS